MRNYKNYEAPQHPEIDDRFHQLDLFNVSYIAYWEHFLEALVGIDGDIVECGIGRARSLIMLASLNLIRGPERGGQRRIYGYDSFSGFPKPGPKDASPRNPAEGEWSSSPTGMYRYTEAFTKQVLEEANLPLEEIDLRISGGFFRETLPSHPERPIALLHLDGDLYESYLDCLTHLYPKVAIGGIIAFDDFFFEEQQDDFPGARIAAKEYLGPEYSRLQRSVSGTPYLVKR